jgi:hypothetical protein
MIVHHVSKVNAQQHMIGLLILRQGWNKIKGTGNTDIKSAVLSALTDSKRLFKAHWFILMLMWLILYIRETPRRLDGGWSILKMQQLLQWFEKRIHSRGVLVQRERLALHLLLRDNLLHSRGTIQVLNCLQWMKMLRWVMKRPRGAAENNPWLLFKVNMRFASWKYWFVIVVLIIEAIDLYGGSATFEQIYNHCSPVMITVWVWI